VATGVALAPLSAEPPDADAALIELGRKLDAAVIATQAFRPTYEAASEAIAAGMRDPENEEALRRTRQDHGKDGFLLVYGRLFGEHDRIIEYGNNLMEIADKLAEAILTRPARTIAGLGVHARALACVFERAWDGPLEDADWDLACVRRAVEAVCALAGMVPLPYLAATA
jgi:hypothetical protein